MSLFKTRDWWSVAVGENETFGQGCLALANIDNEVNSSGSRHSILWLTDELLYIDIVQSVDIKIDDSRRQIISRLT